MTLTHIAATRSAMADAVLDLINAGTTDTFGDLEIMTSGDVEVSTHVCSDPAFNAAAAGAATVDTVADDVDADGGTAALFRFNSRDNTEIFRGSVTATSGGGDIELDNVAVSAGVTVSITSFTYNASA